jgi:hypothetical protein
MVLGLEPLPLVAYILVAGGVVVSTGAGAIAGRLASMRRGR